jgi:glycosyltransferase involved in cell wall biosynthesis
LKVLHINDQAGVSCILAKYQRRNGIESKVLSSYKSDKFGILKFYKDYVHVVEQVEFIDYCISESRNADIIHIHSNQALVFRIRKIFGNSKKIILHYHGTDIRGLQNRNNPEISNLQKIKNKKKLFIQKIKTRLWLVKRGFYNSFSTESQNLANEILVATPDLLTLVPKATYLPNPIDSDHFSKRNDNHNISNNKALTIKTATGDIQKTLEYCKINNINLNIDVYDRTKKPLLYEEIPNFLKKYDIYVDVRMVNGKILENYSKTALESLACGLKVLNYKLEYIDKLPEIHYPTNVTSQLQHIYNKI